MPPDHLAFHVLELDLEMVSSLNARHSGKNRDIDHRRKFQGDQLMGRRQEHVFLSEHILKSLPANSERLTHGSRWFAFHEQFSVSGGAPGDPIILSEAPCWSQESGVRNQESEGMPAS